MCQIVIGYLLLSQNSLFFLDHSQFVTWTFVTEVVTFYVVLEFFILINIYLNVDDVIKSNSLIHNRCIGI